IRDRNVTGVQTCALPIFEKGDWEAAANLVGARPGRPSQRPSPDAKELKNPGWGGHLLLGTPEQIVDELIKLSDVGLDGIVLSWRSEEHTSELQSRFDLVC